MHLGFEALAYAVGFALYRRLRRERGDFLADGTRWTMVVAVVLGAALGAKVLHHAAHPGELLERWREPAVWLGGKTIVGALLGGWIAVELVKRRLGVRRATGDLYALPLVVGIAIGRVGCFLGGSVDGTYGVATALPWGVDFGDGVARHPTQLYEILFLLGLGVVLVRRRGRARAEGADFRLFLAAYLAFRLLVDGWKPAPRLVGLGAIQWAALAGLAWYGRDALRRLRLGRAAARTAVGER